MTIATERLLQNTVLDEQIALETRAVEDGITRYRRLAQEAVDRGEGAALKPAERLLLHWFEPLVEAIRQDQRLVRKGVAEKGITIWGPYLLRVKADALALITMHEIVGQCMSEPGGVLMSKLAHAVGRAVLAEINMAKIRGEGTELVRAMDRRHRNQTPEIINRFARKNLDDAVWNRKVCVHMGLRLVWNTIGVASAASYDEPFQLAFRHERRYVSPTRAKAFLRMDEAVFDLIDDGHRARQTLRPRYLPMLVEPYPWTDDAQGGYVKIRTPYTIKPTPHQKEALANANLDGVNEALSAVGSTPWRINRRVLDVVQALYEQGGGVAGIPHRENFPIPPMPAAAETDEDVKAEWKKRAAETYKANVRLKGRRVEFQRGLHIAEMFKDRDEIFYPHQLDFRGRAYPIPQHLNHQGDDVCRGLLEFAEGKPAWRTEGAKWLWIHAANCFGFDKASYSDRRRWAVAHDHDIAACARDPLANAWWMEAENPFQFLAACFAFDDPAAAAHLPIQLDGTCNGLQHYAAMGRDRQGAEAVNLTRNGEPADVYTAVAEKVRPIVNRDAEAGKPEAVMVADHVGRTVVKQPVMTSVYGVTMSGAKDQVLDKLKKAGMESTPELYKAASYLANAVLRGVAGACPAAADIMDWFKECGRIITAETGQAIEWVTPLGLPVVQPYRNWRTQAVESVLQKVIVRIENPDAPVAPGKQVKGVAPNFVHSIDATHMLMTARACRDKGVAFAAVHDSYWTHAATVDDMAETLREQFVALHEMPLLAGLHAWWCDHYGIELPPPPEPGDYDIHEAMQAEYLFS